MALGSALAFLIKVRDDVTLQTKLRALSPADFDGLLKEATTLGFEAFSKNEFFDAADRVGGEWVRFAALMRGQAPTPELSDAELEKVAGGKGIKYVSVCNQGSWAYWLDNNCG